MGAVLLFTHPTSAIDYLKRCSAASESCSRDKTGRRNTTLNLGGIRFDAVC
jgi:hypothetical protein